MIPIPSLHSSLLQGEGRRRFEVRSVTGARYTLVEEREVDAESGAEHCTWRTAYAGLPVVANVDGSFTIADTRTRLVRVAPG
jgi:hypothetical protein